jgi:hypothetical protein
LRFSAFYTEFSLSSLVGVHVILSVEPVNNAAHFSNRIMHAFNFSLIAVLSCIAMIGATPVGNGAPVEAIAHRDDGIDGEYVVY